MKRLNFLILFLSLFQILGAQVTFKATAEKVVEVGEMFRLAFTVNAQATGFRAPVINDFAVLSGPSTSTSQSYSMVNGKTTQSIESGYIYTLRADKEGKFTIPAAQITVGGKNYTSNSVTIEVLKSASGNTSPSTSDASSNSDTPANEENSGNELFVLVNLSKTEVYQGEPLVATVKIYAKDVNLRDLTPAMPAYNGFWHDELPTPSRITLEREKYNDKIYTVGLLRQDLLIAQSSGKLTIPPMKLEVLVQEKVGQRRDFFGRLVPVYDNVKKTISTPARTVTVKTLPAGKPANFSGLIGTNFKVDAQLSNDHIKTDEGANLKIKISGNGNMKLFNMKDLTFPSGLDAYPPETKQNVKSTHAGTSGSKTFDYFILAREPGEYTLPPVQIPYFDLTTKSYKTLSTPEYKIYVTKGDNYVQGSSGTVRPNDGQSTVENLDSDIRYLNSDLRLSEKNKVFAGSNLFYGLYFIGLILFLIPVFIRRKNIRENADMARTRNKYAAKISQKRLKKAAEFLKTGQDDLFYNEILTALWGYLGDKLIIPGAELTKERIETQIPDAELAGRIVKLLDTCEYARYSTVGEEERPAAVYEKAKNIILDIEKSV